MRTDGRRWSWQRSPIAFCWYATVTLGLGSAALAADPVAPKRVVVIYPVSEGQPGILLFDQRLRSILRARYSNGIEIYNEYLDSARFADEGYQTRLSGFLR